MIATRLLVVALAAASLAACAGAISVESANADGVTIRHTVDSADAAESRANSECDKFGKKARLRSRHSQAESNFAIFDCVPK